MTTNQLTRKIINKLNDLGHRAHRNNTMGVYDPTKQLYRKIAKSDKGVGDILCCLKGGKWLELEVKMGKDKLSEDQKQRQLDILVLGGRYYVITCWDDFLTILEDL